MTFNIGDKVRVKSYEEIKKTLDSNSITHYYYNGDRKYLSFNGCMESFCGNVYTILDISCNGNYELENEEGDSWWFLDTWIEAIEEKPHYVSSFDEDAGIVETEETSKAIVETFRKDQFIKKVLDLEPSTEQCLETDCEECGSSYCVVRQLKNIIQSYRG